MTRRTLAAVIVAVLLTASPARGTDPGDCHADVLQCASGSVVATETDFRGAIIVPGSEAANRAVASSGGCPGCTWYLVVDCDPNEPVDGPLVNCNAARCPGGTSYRVYLQRPGEASPRHLDTVCLTPERRIVTVDDLDAELERHLTALRPPAPDIDVQPDGRAVVGIPTYFVARGARTDRTTLDVVTAAGPARLRIEVAASRYVWEFGDGARCETDEPGRPYDGGEPAEHCAGQVAHAYRAARDATVTLRAIWRGTYSFDVGYGPVGPLPVPGDGVPGPVATRSVAVRPATARLVGS